MDSNKNRKKHMADKTQMNIVLHDDLFNAFDFHCRKYNLNRSALIRTFIKDYLDRQGE